MRWLSKVKTFHELFEIGIIVKGIDGILEFLAGITLFLLNPLAISKFLASVIQKELLEDPKGIIVNFINHNIYNISYSSKTYIILFLLTHGIAKIFLVIGLLRRKLWAYPAAIAAFTLFILYQSYRLAYSHSLFLGLTTAFDIILVILISYEYKNARQKSGLK